jgi:beta-glucosidase-like glycosyl hydrolase
MPFCNITLSPATRALDLVGRLTLREKTAGVLSNMMSDQSKSNGTAIDHNLRQTAGIMRLGVPPLLYNEAMHGIAALCLSNGSCPTVFPNQISQTAGWNRSMWRAVASALGHEGRALANAGLDANNFWAPDVNPYRDRKTVLHSEY